MKLFDCTFPTPAANLAADEVLLDLCEEQDVEVLRFWESATPFVVVGYGNKIATEVNVAACEARGVPVLRRCSGGGTVVQGPGCLNYQVTLRVGEASELATVSGTNRFVMERIRAALETQLGRRITIEGCTDLALHEGDQLLKFSGNAQRRRRNSLLFHGTILYAFELTLISELLNAPSKQPDYRASRQHGSFVTNASASTEELKASLISAWNAHETLSDAQITAIDEMTRKRYSTREWNSDR